MQEKRDGSPPPGPAYTVDRPAGLLEFLFARLKDRSRGKVKSLLERGRVLVDGKPVTRFNHPLRPGQTVSLSRAPAAPSALPSGMRIVFEDEHLIVIDKPAGLLTVATGVEKEKTAYRALSLHVKRASPRNKIFIVHRLDRETSGLLVFARSREVKERLQNDWRTIVHERAYLAAVEGRMEKREGTIESRIRETGAMTMRSASEDEDAKRAVTHFRTLKRTDEFSLLRIELETGRKNQIRVHMHEAGHSVAGDKKYGAATNPIGRLCLHAYQLGFTHPVTGKKLDFTSPMPRSFGRLFQE